MMFKKHEHLPFIIWFTFIMLILIFCLGRVLRNPYFYIQPKIGEIWIYEKDEFSYTDTLKILKIKNYKRVLLLRNSKDTINQSMAYFLIGTEKIK